MTDDSSPEYFAQTYGFSAPQASDFARQMLFAKRLAASDPVGAAEMIRRVKFTARVTAAAGTSAAGGTDYVADGIRGATRQGVWSSGNPPCSAHQRPPYSIT